MDETRTLVACTECKVFWYLVGEPAKCAEADHDHRRFEVHRHRSAVVLPDGTEVTAVSFDAADPYTRDRRPDFGIYLDDRWQPPWPHDHLDWPDFGVPDDPAPVHAALRSLLGRARAGERVEIGCLGGHGRTGTALACLAILSGQPPGEAVAWVRAHYCAEAVETGEQEAFVTTPMDDGPSDQPIRARLRAALATAMKARDRPTVAVLRTVLGAIDNAEAVAVPPPPATDEGVIAGARIGLGAGEATRRALTEDQIAAIVRAEITDRRAAAALYERAGQGDRAERLTTEATILSTHLGEA